MLSYVNVRTCFRICAIVMLLVLVVAVPASAIASPTIDSVTPSTTSVVNGGDVTFTVTGTCSVPVSQAWISYKTPQTGWTTGFNVVTNGNQWTGQYSMNIPSNAQSGQYSVTGIQVEDSAGNHVSKNFNVVVTASNSVTASPPTIDSVTPSTTSISNGGTVIFTVSGTCSVPVSQAWVFYKTPQTGGSIGFNVVTNGNQWTGQYTMIIPSNAQSGQYSITGITVQDTAGNSAEKTVNAVVTASNSATASLPTIDSVTPSTTSVVNGGTVIFTVSGTCTAPISQAWVFYKTPQTGGSIGFNVVTNGNQWTGQYSMNIPSNAQSGQYSITGITVQDTAGNSAEKTVNAVVTATNSGQSTPTSPATPTASPTTIPVTTSLTISITTTPTIFPTSIITTTAVPTTLHITAITTIPTSIPTTGQTTSLTTAPTPTLTTSPTSSVEKLLEEQNKKIDAQNTLIAEQNQKMAEQNDLLTQILNYFKGIFGWK